MRFLSDAPKTALLVNAPRREQLALGPQNHLSITRLARESDALVDQPSAQTQTAPGPLMRRNVSPDVISRSESVRMVNPTTSRRRLPGIGSDSGTPNQIAKKTSVTAIAGTMSVS